MAHHHHNAPTHHEQPHQPAVAVSHVSHQTPKYTDNKPTVRFYTKAKTDYSITIRDGTVVLAPTNSSDPHQHWIKEETFGTRVKDEEGFPAFALVNKATGQALKHATGATKPVQLTEFNPNKLDESVLWTQSKDLGDGYHAVRMVNKIKLNMDASKGEEGIHDGSKILVWEWTKADNQRWTTAPFCIFTVAYLRNKIDETFLPFSEGAWNWSNLVPGKLNVLLWRICHQRLPTLENLCKIGLGSSSTCKLCGGAGETEEHLLVRCPESMRVWSKVFNWWNGWGSEPTSLKEIISCRSNFVGLEKIAKVHEAITMIFCWVVWNHRNKILFSCEKLSIEAMAFEIQTVAFFWIKNGKRRGSELVWENWIADPMSECLRKL